MGKKVEVNQGSQKENVIERARIFDLKAYTEGWVNSKFDEERSTDFTITVDTNAKHRAQVIWLENQTRLWVEKLNNEGNIKVENSEIKVDEELCIQAGTRVKGAKIVIMASIPGLIVFNSSHFPEIVLSISGTIKKQLAINVLKNCPPPFDPQKCAFAAQATDIFEYQSRGWEKREMKNMKDNGSGALLAGINHILDQSNAQLLELSLPEHYKLNIKVIASHKAECSIEQRDSLNDKILEFLRYAGINSWKM